MPSVTQGNAKVVDQLAKVRALIDEGKVDREKATLIVKILADNNSDHIGLIYGEALRFPLIDRSRLVLDWNTKALGTDMVIPDEYRIAVSLLNTERDVAIYHYVPGVPTPEMVNSLPTETPKSYLTRFPHSYDGPPEYHPFLTAAHNQGHNFRQPLARWTCITHGGDVHPAN